MLGHTATDKRLNRSWEFPQSRLGEHPQAVTICIRPVRWEEGAHSACRCSRAMFIRERKVPGRGPPLTILSEQNTSTRPAAFSPRVCLRRVLCVGALAFGATVLPVAAPLGGSSFVLPSAWAQEPMSITGTTVLDNTSVLGDTADLKKKISDLSKNHKVDLHVVTINKFENPSSSSEWAKALAKKNNWGSADAVLVIATESRQAYFIAGSEKTLSSEQQSKVYQDYVKPKLQSGDYKGAAAAAVEGIDAQKSGGSGVVVGAVAVGTASVAAVGGTYLYRRRKKSAEAKKSGVNKYGYPTVPQATIEELQTRAGASLVQADNTLVRSRQEVEFARAQYGDAQVAEFEKEIVRADELMKASFHRQKLLEDDVPDTPAEQRAWLGEIIENSRQVTEMMQAQEEKLSSLRNLEHDAPAAIEKLQLGLPELDQRIEAVQRTYSQLQERYLPSALEPVKENVALIEANRTLLQQELDQANTLLGTSRSEAVVHLRSGEEAAQQVAKLAEAVQNRAGELETAQNNLSTDLLSVQRDIAEANSLAASQNKDDLQAVAAGMEAVLGEVRQQSEARPNDPLALNEQLRQLTSELDKSMTSLRADRERQHAAEQSLERALRSARVQVDSARDFIGNRRGGVGSQARTYLSEAESHLSEAHRLRTTNPASALDSANRAIALATDAQNAANRDMNSYYDDRGGRGGFDIGDSSLAKGMLLGTILGSLSSGSAHGHSGGDSGGFFGGGGFDFGGGGFDFGGGDWGGGGGDGGSF